MSPDIIAKIIIAYEAKGLGIIQISVVSDDLVEIEFICNEGIFKRKVGIFFGMLNDNQCEQSKNIPND